jgi:hypothetical protein
MIQSGDIYEIELSGGLGFGYVKLIDSKDFGLDGHILVRKLNLLSPNPIKKNDSVIFDQSDLVAPSLLLTSIRTRGEKKWKYIGNDAKNIKEFKIPVFKAPYQSEDLENKNWDKLNNWYLIYNLIPNGLNGGYRYTQVKHLPLWKHTSSDNIQIKLSMYWMHRKGIDILEEYKFNWDRPGSSLHEKVLYCEVINSVFYDDLPLGIRNNLI